jgi:hypothetical protein
VVLPCVVRSRQTFDTQEPRDLRTGELAYLYEVTESGSVCVIKLVSLERSKHFVIHLGPSQARKLEAWFELVT